MENTFYKGNLTLKATTEQQISLALSTSETSGQNIIEQLMGETPWVLRSTNKNKTKFYYTLAHEQMPYHEKTLKILTQHGVTVNGEYYNDNIEYQHIKIIRNNKQTNQYEEKSIQEYPQTYYLKNKKTYIIYKIMKHAVAKTSRLEVNTRDLYKLYKRLSDNPETLQSVDKTLKELHQNGFTEVGFEEIAKIISSYQKLFTNYITPTVNNIPKMVQPLKGTITLTTNPQTNSKIKKHTKKPHTHNIVETLLNRNNIAVKHSTDTGTNKNLTMTYAVFQNYIWTENLNQTLTTIVKNNGWVEGTIKDGENNTWIFSKVSGEPNWYTEKTIPAIRDETYLITNQNYLLEYLIIKIQYNQNKNIPIEILNDIFTVIEKEGNSEDHLVAYENVTTLINKLFKF